MTILQPVGPARIRILSKEEAAATRADDAVLETVMIPASTLKTRTVVRLIDMVGVVPWPDPGPLDPLVETVVKVRTKRVCGFFRVTDRRPRFPDGGVGFALELVRCQNPAGGHRKRLAVARRRAKERGDGPAR